MKFYKRLKLFVFVFQVFFLFITPFVFISDEAKTGKIVFVVIFIFEILIMTFLISFYKSKIANISFKDEYVFLTRNDKVVIKELKNDCCKIIFNEFEGKILMYFGNRKYVIQKYYSINYKPIFDFSILNTQNFPNATVSYQ